MRSISPAALTGLVCLSACLQGGPIDPVIERSEEDVLPTGNGALFATKNESADVLDGIHTLFDRTAGRCLRPDATGAAAPELRVGSVQEPFEAVYITSREQLARELGIDVGLKVRYHGVTNVNAAMSMLQQYSRSSRSVYFLLKASQEYGVQNKGSVALTDEAAALLSRGVNDFVQRCGSNYVDGVRYGAQLAVLLSFTAQDETTATEIAASLGASVRVPTVAVSGDLKVRLKTNAARSGVSVSIRVMARGFDTGAGAEVGPALSQLVTSPVDEQTFVTIEGIRAAMHRSVGRDQCRDAGEGLCDGVPSPGAAANRRRWAQPIAVQLGFYESAGGMPAGGLEKLAAMRENIRRTERTVRAFSEMRERMEAAHTDEIDVFLRSPDALKPSFNVAPPGRPRATVAQLVQLANEWRQNFYPGDLGNPVGWNVEQMIDAIDTCWGRIASDAAATCEEPEQSDAFRQGLAQLEKYRDEARILELRTRMLPELAGYDRARAACSLSPDGGAYRLPTTAEAPLLGPLVGFGPLPPSAETPNEVWLMEDSAQCDPASELPEPELFNPPTTAENGIYCAGRGRTMAVICVPTVGPVPRLPDP